MKRPRPSCPTCGMPMIRTMTGYCCEKFGCSRIQQAKDESRPSVYRQEHGEKCMACDGTGFDPKFIGWPEPEECRECNGKGIWFDMTRI